MRAYVFTDKALTRRAGQFVWLSIDTEKKQNAPFIAKYPIRAWPSFYVIDPKTEKITLRWVGGATVAELGKLFDEVRPAGRAAPPGALAKADGFYSEGRYADSIPLYEEALKTLPKTAAAYPRAVESLLFGLSVSDQAARCVAVARESLANVRRIPAAAVVAGSGLDCATSLAPGTPGRAADIAEFESESRAILSDPKLKLAADDRSGLFSSLFDARKDAGDEAGAHRVALDWVADLEAAARSAKTPEQLAALDPDRLSSFQAAGEIEKAIPMLEKSEHDFPKDYNPPARLAHVYLKLKQYDTALAASDRAMALVYGPRKLRVLAERAEIYKAMGNTKEQQRTIDEALAYAEALPAGQRSESAIASLKKQAGEFSAGGRCGQ